MLSAESILGTLDQAADAFIFPMLDNGYVYPVAARLTAFRSDSDWAMVFETFGFSPRAGEPDLAVTTIGSSIARTVTAANFVDEQAYTAHLENNAHWESSYFSPIEDAGWIDAEEGEMVDPSATHLALRGEQVPLPGSSVYREAGIVLSEPPRVMVFELCRALAHTHRGQLLATPAERRANVPAELDQLLVLDDWSHPDVVDMACRPSGSASFRQLATALVSGDAGAYVPLPGNTHWSNWPDGGTL